MGVERGRLDFRQPTDIYRDPLARLVVVNVNKFVAKSYLVRLIRGALMYETRKCLIGRGQQDEYLGVRRSQIFLGTPPKRRAFVDRMNNGPRKRKEGNRATLERKRVKFSDPLSVFHEESGICNLCPDLDQLIVAAVYYPEHQTRNVVIRSD